MYMRPISDPNMFSDRLAVPSFEPFSPSAEVSPPSSDDVEWFTDSLLEHIAPPRVPPWRARSQRGLARNPPRRETSSTSSDSEHVDGRNRERRPSPRVPSRRGPSQGVLARAPSRREPSQGVLARVPSRREPSQRVLRVPSRRELSQGIIDRVLSRRGASQRVPARVSSRREASQGVLIAPSRREPSPRVLARILSRREPAQRVIARVPSRREPSPPRVLARIVQVDDDNPDPPSGISKDGFSNCLSVQLLVNPNPESKSYLNLNGDHLTVRIPPPRLNSQSSAVDGGNNLRRKLSSSSGITSSSSSDCSIPKRGNSKEDFLRLFNNPDSYPDATLKCGNKEIPVHKCILSVRSPVFQALFKSDMKEGRNSIVDIVDIEPDVLEAMLKYVYSGKSTHINTELAEDLLFAADKYQICGLKRACIKKLKIGMIQSNVLRILVLGELHDKCLKEYAIEFIKWHLQFSEVEKTEEWKRLQTERSKLAMEVMLTVVKNLPSRVNRNIKLDSVLHN